MISTMSVQKENENLCFGSMFNLHAKKRIIITKISFCAKEASMFVDYHLYTVNESYVEKKLNLNAWTLISSGRTFTRGVEESTPIMITNPVTINVGKDQGFYFTLTSQHLLCPRSGGKIGEISFENQDFAITSGSGVITYPLESEFDEPKNWCGSVGFHVSPEIIPYNTPISPSMSPTVLSSNIISNTPIELIHTNQTFFFYSKNMNLMSAQIVSNFQDQIEKYLHQHILAVTFPTISVANVIVTNQYIFETEFLQTETMIAFENSSSLDIDYFLSTFHDSMLKSAQSMLSMLQIFSPSYFDNIDQIFSIKTPSNFENYQNSVVNQSISFHGPEIHQIMDYESRLSFENLYRQFLLNYTIATYPNTQILIVHVTHQSYDEVNTGFLTIRVLIENKFLPPPDYDFFSVVQSSIDEHNLILKRLLKESRINIYHGLDHISTLRKSNNFSVLENEANAPPFPIFRTPVGYGIIGVIIFCLFTVLYLVCRCCPRGKKRITVEKRNFCRIPSSIIVTRPSPARDLISVSQILGWSTRFNKNMSCPQIYESDSMLSPSI